MSSYAAQDFRTEASYCGVRAVKAFRFSSAH